MTPSPNIRKIRDLTEADLKEIIEMCLRAYEDEVAIVSMVGGNNELRPLLFSAMLRAGALEGHIYVLEVNGQIVSMSLWFDPGKKIWKTEESRSLGYNEFMEKLDDVTRDWWKNKYGPIAGKFYEESFKVPAEALWWTNILATDPAHQGRGYASMLMEYVLNECTPGTYSGLATTSKDNERFYNRLGYVTKGFMTIPSHVGAWPIWALLRKV